MRRTLPIFILFLAPWILASFVPSVADEFKYRDFGLTNYPGWTVRQLAALGAVLAVFNFGCMLGGLVLFEKRPPPLYWPRAITWWIAFLHAIILIGTSIWDHQLINVTVFFAGLTLWYLFLSENMRFWNARPRQA